MPGMHRALVGLAVLAASVATAAAPAAAAPATRVMNTSGYRVELHVTPNRAPRAITVALLITRNGKPVSAAHVRLTLTMLDMPMPGIAHELRQTAPGRYGGGGLALGMPGRWGFRLDVAPPGARRFAASVVDRVGA